MIELASARTELAYYGDRIRAARQLTGATQVDVARACHIVSAFELSQIETGHRMPTETQEAALTEWYLQAMETVATPSTAPGDRSDVSARHSDPDSSHHAVRHIAADLTLHDAIIEYAERHPAHTFTDDQLWTHCRRRLNHPMLQRNVVARARGLIERDGLLERVPIEAGDRLRFRWVPTDERADYPASCHVERA